MNDPTPDSESASEDPQGSMGALWLLAVALAAMALVIGLLVYQVKSIPPVQTTADGDASPPAPPRKGRPSTGPPSGRPEATPSDAAGPSNRQLEQIERAMRQGDLASARQRVMQLLAEYPAAPPLLILAGRIAVTEGKLEEGLQWYDRVPDDQQAWRVAALVESGTVALRQGNFDQAERRLRRALELNPDHPAAQEQLARLLALEGRRWEGSAQLFALIRSGRAQPHHLVLAANLFDPVDERELLEKARRAWPSQWLPELGLARLDMKAGHWEAAGERLRRLRQHRGDVLAVQVAWGEWLAERRRWEELREWNAQLPSSAGSHPLVWWLRGRWAEATNQTSAAIRCYWESVRRYAGDRRPCHRLGQLLLQEGDTNAAHAYLEYARRLDRLFETVRTIYEDGPKFKHVLAAAQMTESLGRYLESSAWYYLAVQLASNSQEAVDGLARTQDLAARAAGPVDPSANPASRFPQRQRPLPDWSRPVSERAATSPRPSPSDEIAFREVASALGVTFRWHNGDDPREPGIHLYQDFGGGVGAVDYDADGWPDLYLVQGNDHPDRAAPEHRDRLYRNLQGGRLVEVTKAARLEQTGYGQSLAVGDYNGDGWPDLLIANIGENHLLRNEGDGTFTDVSREVGLSGKRWTAAAALVDLDGDGLDDIVLVHYLHGREPLELKCRSGGVVTACRPTTFDAEPDELWWNQGDGTFLPGRLQAEPGRGLGIVAGDFDGDGHVDLFIANDMTANHLYWGSGQRAPLEDQSLLSGVAFDRDGQSQACMGIASGDLNDDGRCDLFVTNFFNESNTLYGGIDGRLFADITAEAGLRDPSLAMLGFGTQAADFDLDGDLDLIVTNGHIDQAPPIQYRMPTQVFANGGGGRFRELPSAQLGDFFSDRRLGRGLIRWDFDRDGRPDVAISHLDQPLAVLRNASVAPHHFLSLRLVGARHRSATGAEIIVTVGDRKRHVYVTCGDGYAAANDRRILIGLGTRDQADRVEVRWPGGETDRYEQVKADRHWVVVEGWERLVVWPLER
ncbi:MAG TPA: tetratricopeptide repeat protein [Planctomycetaceae bacterium]|nr:tetratricopeptide repeat protein [Planctomycetaceae bacterium]